MMRRRRRGDVGGLGGAGGGDVDDELEAEIAVVGEAGEEPAPAGLVQRDDVVAGGPLVDHVPLLVALPERLAVHLRHRVLAFGVVEHCTPRKQSLIQA